jgi:hypothetical protein
MPVPQPDAVQPGTATTAVSTGTYEVARTGIEGQSVRTSRAVVKPTMSDDVVLALDLVPRRHYPAGFNAEQIRERRTSRSDHLVRDLCCAPA